MVSPLMQRVKAQVDVVLPLLQALRAELGEEAAHNLVYPVLRRATKDWVGEFAATSGDPLADFFETSERLLSDFQGDVDMTVLNHDDRVLDVDVTGCRYADMFRKIGEPELGAILTCELDDHIADLSAPAVGLARAETLMQGGRCCPFRYRFRPGAKTG